MSEVIGTTNELLDGPDNISCSGPQLRDRLQPLLESNDRDRVAEGLAMAMWLLDELADARYSWVWGRLTDDQYRVRVGEISRTYRRLYLSEGGPDDANLRNSGPERNGGEG